MTVYELQINTCPSKCCRYIFESPLWITISTVVGALSPQWAWVCLFSCVECVSVVWGWMSTVFVGYQTVSPGISVCGFFMSVCMCIKMWVVFENGMRETKGEIYFYVKEFSDLNRESTPDPYGGGRRLCAWNRFFTTLHFFVNTPLINYYLNASRFRNNLFAICFYYM